MSDIEFASVAKFFVFLLLGVIMVAGLVGFAPNQGDITFTSLISLLNTGYGLLGIGALIVGLAAALKFTNHI